MFGYVFAFLSSFFFSLYVVPRKFSTIKPLFFSTFMGVGFFLSSFLLYLSHPLFAKAEVITPLLVVAFLEGIVWAIGFVLFVGAIDYVGLSRSNQWKNLQGPIGVFLTLFFLSEYTKSNPLYVLIAGIAIFISAVVLTIPKAGEVVADRKKGILLAVLAGISFGTVTLSNKYLTIHGHIYTQLLFWSLGIVSCLLLFSLFTKQVQALVATERKESLLGFFAGVLYLGASFCMLMAYTYIPASIGFTIIQLNTVWTVLLGAVFFGEIAVKLHWGRLTIGLALALGAVLLLAL